MRFRELENEKARLIYESLENGTVLIDDAFFVDLDEDYKKIRADLLSWITANPIEKNYAFDLKFAIKLHNYFSKENMEGFGESVASNYAFWRYICLKVMPDVIRDRHGFVKEYFYAKGVRLYASTLWWYVEMCYQGSDEETYECLKRMSTDYILQIVERPGRDGMFLEVSRRIAYYLAKLPEEVVSRQYNNQTLLRRVAIQNTAKGPNYNLVLDDKVDEYVVGLFKSCGVEVSEYGLR